MLCVPSFFFVWFSVRSAAAAACCVTSPSLMKKNNGEAAANSRSKMTGPDSRRERASKTKNATDRTHGMMGVAVGGAPNERAVDRAGRRPGGARSVKGGKKGQQQQQQQREKRTALYWMRTRTADRGPTNAKERTNERTNDHRPAIGLGMQGTGCLSSFLRVFIRYQGRHAQ